MSIGKGSEIRLGKISARKSGSTISCRNKVTTATALDHFWNQHISIKGNQHMREGLYFYVYMNVVIVFQSLAPRIF